MGSSEGIPAGESLPLRIKYHHFHPVYPLQGTDGFFKRNPHGRVPPSPL